MYRYPDRKKYRYIIPTVKGDCELVFQQATARETQDYLEMVNLLLSQDINDQIRWLTLQKEYFEQFIKTNIVDNKHKTIIVPLVIWELDTYKYEISTMLHPTRKSMYSEQDIPKIKWKNIDPYPFDNHYEVICKKTLIPIDQLYDRLTMEQIWWYLDKIVYDNYETFKEGKAINKKVMTKWGLSDEQKRDLEIIKQNLHSNDN